MFTVGILKSPGYTGPLGSSWQGVDVTAVDERTVRFELDTPIGGFLQAATIGLLPVAPAERGPGRDARPTTRSASSRSAPGRSCSPRGTPNRRRSPRPAWPTRRPASPARRPARPGGVSPRTDRPGAAAATATPRHEPTPDADRAGDGPPGAGRASQPGALVRPRRRRPDPEPGLPGIEMTFFPDAAALAAAYRAGDLDAASGLPPELANQLAAVPTAGS